MRAAGWALGALVWVQAVHAARLHVCPDGTGDYPNLNAAVAAAFDGDVIELCDGVFEGLDNLQIDVGSKDLTFRSLSGYEATTIYGVIELPEDRFAYPVFTVGTARVRFEGITSEAAGYRYDGTVGDGAAIRCVGGDIELQNVRILGGDVPLPARYDGGVAIIGGSISATDCIFNCDATERGGAIYAETEAVVVTRCVFDGSASCGGGAIWLEGGIVEDSSFHQGSVINCDDNPGGLSIVAAGSGSVAVVGCRFADRHDNGGAGPVRQVDRGVGGRSRGRVGGSRRFRSAGRERRVLRAAE